jgi:hypothetical protein
MKTIAAPIVIGVLIDRHVLDECGEVYADLKHKLN